MVELAQASPCCELFWKQRPDARFGQSLEDAELALAKALVATGLAGVARSTASGDEIRGGLLGAQIGRGQDHLRPALLILSCKGLAQRPGLFTAKVTEAHFHVAFLDIDPRSAAGMGGGEGDVAGAFAVADDPKP